MGIVKGTTYYFGPKLQEGVELAQPLMLQDDGALCRTFRKALLESQLEFHMRIQLPNLKPLRCQWGRAGQTAGVAAWVFEKDIEAVTVVLSGIDRKDEAAAVEAMLGSKPLPIPLYRWHQVRDAEHPSYATFHFTPGSVVDASISTAAPALAHTFFSILGIVEERDGSSE